MPTYCTCGGNHDTFGACMRAKHIRVGYCQSARGLDATAQRNNERELALYKSAREQGVQPAGTRTHQIRYALDQSDQTGRAFDAAVGPEVDP